MTDFQYVYRRRSKPPISNENSVVLTALPSNHHKRPRPVYRQSNHGTVSSSSSKANQFLSLLDNPVSNSLQNDEMAYGDRTQEFKSICTSFQLKLKNNYADALPRRKRDDTLARGAEFNRRAKKVGVELTRTFQKLEQLTAMIRKRSIFESGHEIDRLTNDIKIEINALNKEIAELQRFSTVSVTEAPKTHQNTSHSKGIVLGLQSKLVTMSNEFKSVLETRTENLRLQRERREKLGENFQSSNALRQPVVSSDIGKNMGSFAQQSPLGSLLLDQEFESRTAADGSLTLNLGNPASQQQSMQFLDQQDAYLRSRADAMQNIESTIVDLGQIFSQLAHMVQEQGEIVQRIDAHVEETHLNVEAAYQQLLRYMHSISGNRWLAIKIFGVLIVFFLLFIVFLA